MNKKRRMRAVIINARPNSKKIVQGIEYVLDISCTDRWGNKKGVGRKKAGWGGGS